jgi:hypothetical protein
MVIVFSSTEYNFTDDDLLTWLLDVTSFLKSDGWHRVAGEIQSIGVEYGS